MRAKRGSAYPVQSLLLAAFLVTGWAPPGQSQGGAPDKAPAEDAAGSKEFLDRVQGYVQLHKSVESTLPSLKPTDLPEMIAAHEQALARKIQGGVSPRDPRYVSGPSRPARPHHDPARGAA